MHQPQILLGSRSAYQQDDTNQRTHSPTSTHPGTWLCPPWANIALGHLNSAAATSPCSPTHHGQQPSHKAGPSNQPNQGPATPTRPTTAYHSRSIHVVHPRGHPEAQSSEDQSGESCWTHRATSAKNLLQRSGNKTNKQSNQRQVSKLGKMR